MAAATKSYKSLNTFKQYYTLDSTDYWHIQYPLNSNWEDYYWDMSEKAFQCQLKRDENGVTVYFGEDGKQYYSSIEVAQYAMASYQAYLKTSDEKWLKDSFRHIDYFLSMAVEHKEVGFTVLNNYPISLYEIYEPWPTGLGFGVAISLLVRLHERFNRPDYLEKAIKIADSFYKDVELGGVRRHLPEYNITILEEYPSSKVSGVLNGHIFALWSLFDLGKYSSPHKDYFDELSRQLAKNLNLWDGRYWSLYDLGHLQGRKFNRASAHYHMLHIKQIFILFRLTGRKEFADFNEKIIKNKYGIFSRIRALINKVIFRLRY